MAAQLFCIAPLENPRFNGLYVYFDASLFPTNDKTRPLLAGLRYFNSLAIQFHPTEPNLCAIVANVVKYEPKAYSALHPKDSTPVCEEHDYDLVGDIVHLIPLPGVPHASASFPPYMSCAGSVASHDNESVTFTMTPKLWTSSLQGDGVFPCKGFFPNNNRWKNKHKILPTKGSYVTIGGRLHQAINRPNNGGPAESYLLEIDNVAFSPRIGMTFGTDPTTPPPPKRRKIAYTFDNTIPTFTSSSTPASSAVSQSSPLSSPSSELSQTPSTPNPRSQLTTSVQELPGTPCPPGPSSRPASSQQQPQLGPSSSRGGHSMVTRHGTALNKQQLSSGKGIADVDDL